jgi:dethiobiotin synthetase
MRRLVVTGTGTEIGKTIVTAAIAALARDTGQRVAVVKAAQTGIGPGDESDVDTVRRLSGVDDVHELVRYPDPLAPATAARRANQRAVTVGELALRVRALFDRDLVLVEGAGGLLVRYDEAGQTLADLATAIAADVLLVTPAGLGTLNATALTCAELRRRALTCVGVVVGAWPAQPDLAARSNLDDLPSYAAAPLLGVLPQGLGTADATTFLGAARSGLAPALGGQWCGTQRGAAQPRASSGGAPGSVEL